MSTQDGPHSCLLHPPQPQERGDQEYVVAGNSLQDMMALWTWTSKAIHTCPTGAHKCQNQNPLKTTWLRVRFWSTTKNSKKLPMGRNTQSSGSSAIDLLNRPVRYEASKGTFWAILWYFFIPSKYMSFPRNICRSRNICHFLKIYFWGNEIYCQGNEIYFEGTTYISREWNIFEVLLGVHLIT